MLPVDGGKLDRIVPKGTAHPRVGEAPRILVLSLSLGEDGRKGTRTSLGALRLNSKRLTASDLRGEDGGDALLAS
jgi:hypothetical protein